MNKIKRIFTIIIISLTALFLIFKFIVYPYLNACINARDEVAYYAEALMISPESANKIISYDMLPKKYQSEISLEEYQNADEPTELLELYSNSVFKQNRKRRVSIELSTEGCKKTAEGYFKAGDKWYYVSHEIDVIPAFFTLKPKIVRWNIEITEELFKALEYSFEYESTWREKMTKEDMRNIGKEALRKLDELGITYEAEELDQILFGYPEDMMTAILENMGTKEIEAMVLEHIAYKYYNQESDTWEGGNDRLYAFDVERFWGDMYGDPLECLNTLFDDEFVISDVKEDFENAEDTGKVSLDFKINDKEYHYDADWHYDWFDTKIFRYIAALTDSEATGKHLYVTAVGPQSIMLVYETEEWAKKFGELFWTLK